MVLKKPLLYDIRHEGDKTIFSHIQDNKSAMKEAAECRKHYDPHRPDPNNFMVKVACIPKLIWMQHPEWENDEKALKQWLNSDEGRAFKCTR